MTLVEPVFSKLLSVMAIFIKNSRFFLALTVAGILGAVLCLTPPGLYLEEEFGLAWLFLLRGELEPPKDVVIISVDQASAEILKLPDNPEKWPREYYAQLLDKINRQRPAVIALNIVFNEPRDADIDLHLAKAIAQGNNVILSNYLKHKTVPTAGGREPAIYESLIASIDSINSAALGTAPFLLPKTSSTVKQFWLNKDSAGDLGTFPYLVFQYYVFKAAYPEIRGLLETINPSLVARLPRGFVELANQHAAIEGLEQVLGEFSNVAEDLPLLFGEAMAKTKSPARQQRLLGGWLDILANKSLYLNHYGNVGTITTIPFYQALQDDWQGYSLQDKVVMIGYSESIEPEKAQGLYTVFSDANNQTTSPIDIAATAVANLIDNVWLRPLTLGQQFLILLAWGGLLSALCMACPYRLACGAVLVLGGAYGYLAYYEFAADQVWLPLVIPLIIQMPIIFMLTSIVHFRRTHQAKTKYKTALGNLLPDDVVAKIPLQPKSRLMVAGGQLTQGVCLATDVRDYTKLSEALAANALVDLMDDYYELVFPRINEYGGFITDLAGDGLLAVWSVGQERQLRINACHAALNLKDVIGLFNQNRPHPLVTRFGLACGEVGIGHTGAPGRYVYRAVGNPVNTASRIEGLNKYLGTQILASGAVIKDLEELFLREMGLFTFKGQSKPVAVFELMATLRQIDEGSRTLATVFGKALKLFQSQQCAEALAVFLDIQRQFPDDGPTRFFIRYLRSVPGLLENSHGNQLPMVINLSSVSF